MTDSGQITDADQPRVEAFIARWQRSEAAERANYALFLVELCDVLGLPHPDPTTGEAERDGYVFERAVVFHNQDGTTSNGFIDLYRRGCFVLETKQGCAAKQPPSLLAAAGLRAGARRRGAGARGSPAWDAAMLGARGQAEQYAKALPEWPPFLVIIDVGHSIELYADFSGTGKHYAQFPDATGFRTYLADLARDDISARLKAIWLDPLSLDPSRKAAEATRDIAARLALLSRSLEQAGHNPERVATFLMRCLFTMFAEDVGLLRHDSFRALLGSLAGQAASFAPMMRSLWRDMDKGGFSPVLRADILRFNGGLFADSDAIDLTDEQLALLIDAAGADWAAVEPAIFGTLLERALDARERAQLGAHYTPRAYVERLVLPTLIEPLRADWESVKAAAVECLGNGENAKAAAELRRFHEQLCRVTVLDPACGSGNFLYVALEHMKRLEGEVLDMLRGLGETPYLDELGSHTVDPHQLLGIEANPRAAAITELVLWIGYLQWHFRTRGKTAPAEPVLKNFHNIETRDAVLAWKRAELVRDDKGRPLTRWDGRTRRANLLTGEDVPDEAARVEIMRYVGAVPAKWPKADFIIGNPPFIGGKDLRAVLGEGYAEALWSAYPEMPKSADLVLYWWHRAAREVASGRGRRFGLITTNSLPQAFGRRVVEAHLGAKDGISLSFAIPDHPWVDASTAAAVRIAMTVGIGGAGKSGRLLEAIRETPVSDGEAEVEFSERVGIIHADLRIGADITRATPLRANAGLCSRGVQLMGAGFIVTATEARQLGLGRIAGLDHHIRPYLNGRDLTGRSRGVMVIDLFGLSEAEVRQRFPDVYQRLLDRVKPERDQNNRSTYRVNWWIFGEPRADLRPALHDLSRYIATVETAKHRIFTFVGAALTPDNKLIVFALEDGFYLGIISSKVHLTWFAACRALLEGRPVYVKSDCFDPFPFPQPEEQKSQHIRALAEELDRHRKERQRLHPELTLTAIYNVLDKLRSGETLSAAEHVVHEQGLVGVLKTLHDDLDRAVLAAYGWPETLSDDDILERLVALNRERAEEEWRGTVRWLRPSFQAGVAAGPAQRELEVAAPQAAEGKQAWPQALPDQFRLVRALLAGQGRPIGAAALVSRFSRVRRDRLTEVLDTLVSLGQARKTEGDRYIA